MGEPRLHLCAAFSNQSAVPRPSFLHGWPFLRFIPDDEDDALPIKALALPDGPVVVFNASLLSLERLEDRLAAQWWLPLVLHHLAQLVLDETRVSADGIGRYTGVHWDGFRQAICRYSLMSWDEIVAASRRNGLTVTPEDIALWLYEESGLESRLRNGLVEASG